VKARKRPDQPRLRMSRLAPAPIAKPLLVARYPLR
jgi:hypothetical protein